MNVATFEVNVQPLYDVAVLGKDIHRPDLEKPMEALMRARHYTALENIILKYKKEQNDKEEVKVEASDNSDETIVRIKIFALFVQTNKDCYSKSSREELKRKLGLNELNCNYYMPELIDGRTREWVVDNLEDAINALRK